jgi:hypothetical protein
MNGLEWGGEPSKPPFSLRLLLKSFGGLLIKNGQVVSVLTVADLYVILITVSGTDFVNRKTAAPRFSLRYPTEEEVMPT